MTGFTKLFGTIVASTIWRETKETKIVWVTMLAMANKNGIVEASIPGLADMARVSIQECIDALQCLEGPDEYSRTKEHDGRRIKPVDGGWLLLNYAKYRAKMNADERREYLAQKQREHRAKAKDVNSLSTNVNKRSDSSTASTHAEAEAEAFQPPSRSRAPLGSDGPAGMSGFSEFWDAYPKRKSKGEAEKAWRKNKCSSLMGQILDAIESAKRTNDWRKDGGQFIPHPATWLNRRGWEDEREPRAVAALPPPPNYKNGTHES